MYHDYDGELNKKKNITLKIIVGYRFYICLDINTKILYKYYPDRMKVIC